MLVYVTFVTYTSLMFLRNCVIKIIDMNDKENIDDAVTAARPE